VHAVDFSGKPLWSKQLVREVKDDGTMVNEKIEAPTACFNNTVLVGTLSGKLYALDAEDGKEKWVYDVGESVLGTANVQSVADAKGQEQARVFVIGQGTGVLHCIDFNTGKGLWASDGVSRCDGSASVAKDVIVFGSCAAALHVFATADGALLKDIPIDDDSQVAGGVVLIGDSAFSGSHSGALVHANRKSGEIVWTNRDSTDEVFTTPAVDDTWVVFGSYDENVYALDRKTGKLGWKFEAMGLPASPVIAGDKVVVCADGTLYLLSLKDGAKRWSYEVSDECSSPAIINGMIVVGSEDGTVQAFGSK
jgi:outer membrane protein assembly factor BamB